MVRLEEVKGIGEVRAQKLRSVGIVNAEMLALCDCSELRNRTKFDETICKKMIDNALSLLPMYAFKNGLTVHAEQIMKD
jgi:predicted RecB family nuclease